MLYGKSNIIYHIPITTKGGDVSVMSTFYEGAMQEVSVDESRVVPVIYPPYKAQLGNIGAGERMLHMTLYGNRYNSFGPLHLADEHLEYSEPAVWRSIGDMWCYEYRLRPIGIMTAPRVTETIRNF